MWPTPPLVDFDVADEQRNAVAIKYAQLVRLRRNVDGETAGAFVWRNFVVVKLSSI